MNISIEKNTFNKINALSKEANRLTEKGAYTDALWKYNEAIELIEKPKNIHDAYTWLLSSVGNIYYLKKSYSKAANAFYDALNSVNGSSKGFIYLRLGQCLYELDDMKESKEKLFKAYMIDGSMLFKDEPRKFISHIQDQLVNNLFVTSNSLNIDKPLPIQKQETIALFERLEEQDGFLTLENEEKKVIQFAYSNKELTIDIPDLSKQGGHQKILDFNEAKDIISYFFENQIIPEIDNLFFEKW